MEYVLIGLAIFIGLGTLSAVRIVPQSEKYVVERLGRLRVVLDPGLNLIVPLLDSVKHRVSVLERQLPSQIALKQVEAMEKVASKQGNQTILLPAAALDAFKDAFRIFGRARA